MSTTTLNSGNDLTIRRQEQNRIAITLLLQRQHKEKVARALASFKGILKF